MIINGLEFLNIKEMSKLLHCSSMTAYKIAAQIGVRLPKPSGKWYIPTTALMQYLTSTVKQPDQSKTGEVMAAALSPISSDVTIEALRGVPDEETYGVLVSPRGVRVDECMRHSYGS